MSTTSIDELLLGGGNNVSRETIVSDEPEDREEIEYEESEEAEDNGGVEEEAPDESADDIDEPENPKARKLETDEYGNEKEPENEVIRERLRKQAESLSRKHEAEIAELRTQLAQQGASQQVQKAAEDFQYDPNEGGDWQQQLASFVKQTVKSMGREEDSAQQRAQERERQIEFETKFKTGMENFNDFSDVIGGLPFQISDAMTVSTRAMKDPAAFLYAAAKRQAPELERIAKIRDPYVQMAEMGKLEERMRKNKPTTKAPRPLERSSDNATTPSPKKKTEPSIEELIAHADKKKLNRIKGRQGGRR